MAENSSFENLGPRWYVVHTYTGYENKVKANLEKIVENRNLSDTIFDCIVPVETVTEIVGGKEKVREVKLYPSYVFVKMCMSDASWHVVRNISGVTGFVGPGSKPVPLRDDEVALMGIETKVVELGYAVGDSVRVISGALTGFVGVVKEISEDKKKIMLLASMFGRETPVELDADAVEKLEV
ncbi:MAG: transcription termination/antitermination factor NusG [Clostridia bacterium]|nr:transcription termination/antitermination factor NusG [Clostridia bacterium]